MKKSPDQPPILFGVCGIGNGHTNRQLPLIEHFAQKTKVAIFGYGESYKYFSSKFDGNDAVKVLSVEVPFYVNNGEGIDFEASAKHPRNQDKNSHAVNSRAIAEAQNFFGIPQLVISDYEPISAQYAYAYNAPLVTIDQQSKYLWGNFPDIAGESYQNEIVLLRMFFPKAVQRMATSFFKVTPKANPTEVVDIYPVILKDEITTLQRQTTSEVNSVLIYLSPQQRLDQPLSEIADICRNQADRSTKKFHIFSPERNREEFEALSDTRIKIYQHGDPIFYSVLQNCTGIVSTAGHTLLSEAMHLGIPVYAIPFTGLYEQQMNAKIIAENNFGISHHCIDEKCLKEFIEGIPDFATTIHNDHDVLLRGPSQKSIIRQLEKFLV